MQKGLRVLNYSIVRIIFGLIVSNSDTKLANSTKLVLDAKLVSGPALLHPS